MPQICYDPTNFLSGSRRKKPTFVLNNLLHRNFNTWKMSKRILLGLMVMAIVAGCHHEEKKPAGFAHVRQVETGTPVHVMLTSYSTTLRANGSDQTLMRITLADSLGREILSAKDTLRVTLDGAGKLSGADGEALALQTDTAGRQVAVLVLIGGEARLTYVAGTEEGKVKLEVSCGKLWPASHELHLVPGDFKMMAPAESQLPPTTKPIARMVGADISWLPEMEARGEKIFFGREEKDGVQLLRDCGFNTVRLRVFVNPEHEKGYSPGKGFCDTEHTLAMARRVKEAGMDLLLNFHYSDYWADPQQQNQPHDWAGKGFDALCDSVTAHTIRVMTALHAQGTPPAMVQVGNEINHGMLWPDGHISQPDHLAALLKAGVEAVEAVDPSVPIMMHIALGGQNDESVFWLDNMIARGVRFDLIGLSYYPRWHGTLDDLQANMLALTQKYHKPVNVVEYSWYKKEVHDIVFSLPGDMGKGACIWEPYGWGERVTDRQKNTTALMEIYRQVHDTYLVP